MRYEFDKELIRLCDGDITLYKMVVILDKYDLGGTTSEDPGKYIQEARELLSKRQEIHSVKQLERAIASIYKKQFGFIFGLGRRYRKPAADLWEIINN